MLKTLVIERGMTGGEMLNTDLIEDYIGFESIKGPDLAKKMTDHALKFGAEIVMDTVESIAKRDEGDFDVKTQLDKTYTAPAVIITAGGTPRKLDVPGEKEYAGRGVSYCAVCDGAFFKGEILAVVGGGDAAVEEADYLTRYAEKVYLIHRRGELRASPILQKRAFNNPKIEVIWNKVVEEIHGEPKGVTHLTLQDTQAGESSRLDVGGVFIFIGFNPNSGLIKGHFDHDDGAADHDGRGGCHDGGHGGGEVPHGAAGRGATGRCLALGSSASPTASIRRTATSWPIPTRVQPCSSTRVRRPTSFCAASRPSGSRSGPSG
jgi:thioredoxin reductase (NADPH)